MNLVLGRRANTASSRSIGFQQRVRANGDGALITYAGEGHVLTLASTGTGKTSGPVICNALTHEGQLIVIDIKGEVYVATAKARRAMGQEVHVLDLRDGGMEGSLNPLDLAMRCGTEPAAVARAFAAELIERSEGERDRYWNDAAETLITGVVAWMMADTPSRTLGMLFDTLNAGDVPFALAKLIDEKKVNNRAALAAFHGFLQLAERETQPSVLGCTQVHVRLFDSELSRRLTDTSSLDIDGLIAGKPMSLYIIVPPYRLRAFSPLLRLWLSGLLMALTNRASTPATRTLMLCDEIGNLGRIDAFVTAATLMRSWGVSLWTFWQNYDQLKLYGSQANTILDNAGVIQCFGARNQRMAQEFAALIGGVRAEDVLGMGPREQLLLIEGGTPLRCRQVRYYEDELFAQHAESGRSQSR